MIKKIFVVLIIVVLAAIGYFVVVASTGQQSNESTKVSKGNYIALGDSVAAGVGLADYSDSSACNRTKQSYPNIVASKLHYSLQNQACSGASTQAGLLNSQTVNNLLLPPQINAIDVSKTPKLLSITIGANDANWTDFIQTCYTESCGSNEDTTTVNSKVSMASTNLDTALARISARYASATPTVAITGYYKLFASNPSQSCAELTGIDKNELAWIAELQSNIDTMLKTIASKYTFAVYIPIDFANHQLCSQDSWVQGINDTAPFHPTQKGQEEIANQMLTVLKTKGYKE